MSAQLLQNLLTKLGLHQVGGITKVAPLAPTVTTSAYAAGDSIGGSIEIPEAVRGGSIFSGIIKSVSAIFENSVTAAGITIHFFNDDPGAVDNAAFDPSDAVLATKIPGKISLTTADHLTEFDTRDILEDDTFNLPYQIKPTKKLYMVIVAGGAITFTATDQFFVNLGLLLD